MKRDQGKNNQALQVHGTAISIGGDGVLIRGAPGSGKSDLALRMIDGDDVRLVSDDRIDFSRDGNTIIMSPPKTITGLLEVRGVGVVRSQCEETAPLRLIIELRPSDDIDRMPERKTESILDIDVPMITLNPFEYSAPAKLRLALQIATGKATLIE